ncbi:dTMP kinase [Aestuariispira ectoiniformans]|uniref:dTMP kinase n=1 Tax=Aestuariispira ectoiniformans TaxID=2775080 RepID=UPI00223B6A42|nr:dTMP kinase [Aestuariispira ectoiniformans]
MAQGRFISFEGGEGAGKSTQIAFLTEHLEKAGIRVLKTREPGGSAGAEEIRKLLVTGDPGRWDAMTELLLLYAARRDHVERVIKPALAKNTWVICDRFADSTMAYQGYGHELGREAVQQLHKLVLGDFTPDMTILLDLPVAEGLARTQGRDGDETRYEEMEIAFHERMRAGFEEMAGREPERFTTIDANAGIEEVAHAVWTAVAQKFNLLAK